MNNNMADFIAQQRKGLGMTQKQLAEKLNVTDKAISKWERGGGHPDITILEPLSQALNTSVSELLKGVANEADDARQKEQIVMETLSYADDAQKARQAKNSTLWITLLSAAGMIAILTTIIVNVAIKGRLTWSLYPIASIIFAELCILPIFYFQKKPVAMALASLTLFSLPFLYVLSLLTGGGWFFPVAFPIALVSLAFLHIVHLVFSARLSLWNKLALSAVATGLLTFFIDQILIMCGLTTAMESWTFLKVVIALFVSLILFGIGRVVASRRL